MSKRLYGAELAIAVLDWDKHPDYFCVELSIIPKRNSVLKIDWMLKEGVLKNRFLIKRV